MTKPRAVVAARGFWPPAKGSSPMVDQSVAEEWRPIPGWKGWYEASSLGRVRRVRPSRVKRNASGFVIKPRRYPSGYLYATLCKGGDKKTVKIHRAVLSAFKGLCPTGKECDHKNGVRDDNRIGNLRWVTKATNLRGRFLRHGGAPWGRGEKNYQAKMNDAQARLIRACVSMGLPRGWQMLLSELWGVSAPNVCMVATGTTYRAAG